MLEKGKKPTPKTQKEIGKSLQTPYDENMGNPNDTAHDPQNRANHLSFKKDTTKPFSIGLKDNTEAIFYYMDKVISPTIRQNGKNIKVPIIYGSAEKWKQIQKDGYYRSKDGKIMMPLISFKRDRFENNVEMSNKIDANNPHNLRSFSKTYNRRNSYDNFDMLNNRVPQKEFHNIVIPEYVTIYYDFIISTYYMEQMDGILEAINFASNSYWGEPNRFKFKASIDSMSTPIEMSTKGERVVQSKFTLKVSGYIIPKINSTQISSLRKSNNKNQVIIKTGIINK